MGIGRTPYGNGKNHRSASARLGADLQLSAQPLGACSHAGEAMAAAIYWMRAESQAVVTDLHDNLRPLKTHMNLHSLALSMPHDVVETFFENQEHLATDTSLKSSIAAIQRSMKPHFDVDGLQ